jgi:uncharacterized protein YecT (DUF1311 family)
MSYKHLQMNKQTIKKLLSAALAMALTGAALAQDLSDQFQEADAELNRVYKELRSLLNPDQQKQLKAWQLEWVQKNERMVNKAGNPADKASVLLEPTQTRLAELEALLEEMKMDAERELDFEDQNGKIRYLTAHGSDGLLERDFPQASLRLTFGITIAPGVIYSGRDIRGMSPELAYISTETNKKLAAFKLTDPEDGYPTLEGFTWNNAYYLAPDGSFAIVEVMEDEAFHTDGAQGKTLYCVYELPGLDEVLSSASAVSDSQENMLRPVKALTKAQLKSAYPEAQPTNSSKSPN